MKAWKIRKLAEDVVWDLRNRGLLPIVALLVVAIAVVPILIMRGGEKASDAGASVAVDPVSAPEAESAVLAYNPGLRDYRERLKELAAKNPFKQHFQTTSSVAALTSEVGGSTESVSISDSAGEVEIKTGGGDGGDKSKTVVKTKYVSYALDVAVGVVGDLKSRKNVEPLSFLPGEATPVMVFLGVGDDGDKAMFLVSSDVSAASGTGTCVPSGGSPCEVLMMRPGQVEDLTYTPDGRIYRLKVSDIRKIVRTVTG
jgi:hypothetical protein